MVSTFQSYDSVLLNNRAAGLQATNYLLDLGHRRIAMITGADHLEPGHERRLGFSEAFRKRGIPLDNSLIRNGAFRDAEAFSEFRRLLSEDNSISAVLVGSDQMFIGVMRALNHFGLECPDGISMVTIDDFPLAGVFNPRMTSVRQPVREMAQLSLQLLLRRMTSGKAAEAEHHVLEPTLIVRELLRAVGSYRTSRRKSSPSRLVSQASWITDARHGRWTATDGMVIGGVSR